MHFVDTRPLSVDEQPSLEGSLIALKEHIAAYRSALTDEGVWLFLATLGCWSVGPKVLQFLAFALAAVMFGDRMAMRVSEKRSFSKLARAVELRIATTPDLPEERSKRLNELLELRQRQISTLTALRHGRLFLLAWSFYVASFLYCVAGLASKGAG